jgi:hypothetical protein
MAVGCNGYNRFVTMFVVDNPTTTHMWTPEGLLEHRCHGYNSDHDVNPHCRRRYSKCAFANWVDPSKRMRACKQWVRYVGPAGSVRNLVEYGAAPGCGGFDRRMLRIYGTNKRKQVAVCI